MPDIKRLSQSLRERWEKLTATVNLRAARWNLSAQFLGE